MTADDADLDELVRDFVIESREHLANVETDLLGLEGAGGDNDDATNRVFRAVHSVKGVAGFLGFENINRLAHALESVLDLVRKSLLEPSPDLIDVLLSATDRLRELIERVGESGEMSIDEQLHRLDRFLVDGAARPSGVAEELAATPGESRYELHVSLQRLELARGLDGQAVIDLLASLGRVVSGAGDLLSAATVGQRSPVRLEFVTSSSLGELQSSLLLEDGDIAVLQGTSPGLRANDSPGAESHQGTSASNPPVPAGGQAAVSKVPPAGAAGDKVPDRGSASAEAAAGVAAPSAAKGGNEGHQESIRVSVELLDRLMNLSGELVLGRNQLLQALASGNEKGLAGASTRLNQVVSEMQEAIMRTRMQPIGSLFQRFPRVVRDLAGKLGKRCRLEIDGKDVDLDRSILEALSDPLTHIVRNSVDHGMELPDQRRAASKAIEGVVRMSATQQGGNVRIEIRDDGRGMDAKRLKAKAVERGVITPAEAEVMSDREAISLIFAPGFSTAEKVTDVSGRGVGMDVVRSNIERLGGNVDVISRLGHGTTLTITIPLTLAILPAMVISCGPRRYVLAQANVAELVRIRHGEGAASIVRLDGREVMRLRGAVMPLLRLRKVLGEPSADNHRDVTVVVVESTTLRYGLVVDAPPDAEEIVVKPLSRHFKVRPEYAGATILGDGCVAMILDATGLAEASQLKVVQEAAVQLGAADRLEQRQDTADLVLFCNHPEEMFAAPLGLVDRIQRVDLADIEELGDCAVYNDGQKALPIVYLDRAIRARAHQHAGSVSVLVMRVADRQFGIATSSIDDIRSLVIEMDDRMLASEGVLGSFQHGERIVRLLDPTAVGRAALPQLFPIVEVARVPSSSTPAPAAPQPDVPPPAAATRVLFAEDTKFFREHVTRTLRAAGFDVTPASDGEQAWQKLVDGQQFDIVVTDVQMPNCDGLQLTQRIRQSEAHRHLPVVALTSLSSTEDQRLGESAGVTAYLIKLDDSALVAAVQQYTGVMA